MAATHNTDGFCILRRVGSINEDLDKLKFACTKCGKEFTFQEASDLFGMKTKYTCPRPKGKN